MCGSTFVLSSWGWVHFGKKILIPLTVPSASSCSKSVLPETAIFPKKEGKKREISNESERGSSLREANV